LPAALDRLKKRSEFLAVAAANRRWTTPGLVLQAKPHTHIPHDSDPSVTNPMSDALAVRVGFTATKKIGNAVKRNRARRRLRAAVDEVLRGTGASGADLVVVARQGTITRSYADLKSDLTVALKRFGIVT
jgi:ribonuclease P protein component